MTVRPLAQFLDGSALLERGHVLGECDGKQDEDNQGDIERRRFIGPPQLLDA